MSYFADTRNGGSPTRPIVIVNAENGQILQQYDGLQHALVGTGPGGNAKTGQYEYGTNYGKFDVTQSGTTCTMNNTNVKTVNLNHGSTNTTAFSYTCPRNTVKVINGAFCLAVLALAVTMYFQRRDVPLWHPFHLEPGTPVTFSDRLMWIDHSMARPGTLSGRRPEGV